MTTRYCNSIRVLLAVVIGVGFLSVMGFSAATAEAALTPSPVSGPIGISVTVCGSGMKPGATIPAGNTYPNPGLYFAPTTGSPAWNTSTIAIDSLGKMCASMLTVPEATAAEHTVVAIDSKGGKVTGKFTITRPKITISPEKGYRGQTVKVTGSNWVPGPRGQAMIGFGATAATAVNMVVATPDANGHFSISFTVPATAGSTNWVTASDVLGNTAPAQQFLLESASLTVNPTKGVPGTWARVTGKGLRPQSAVEELRFGSFNIMPSKGLVTGKQGTFSASFKVPALAGGSYTVSAKVAGFTVSTCCFTITEAPAVNGQSKDPVAVPVNMALATISEELVRVWGYYGGEWQMYDPADLIGSSLSHLTRGRGYWIKVSEDCTLIFRKLTAGWNVIGW